MMKTQLGVGLPFPDMCVTSSSSYNTTCCTIFRLSSSDFERKLVVSLIILRLGPINYFPTYFTAWTKYDLTISELCLYGDMC